MAKNERVTELIDTLINEGFVDTQNDFARKCNFPTSLPSMLKSGAKNLTPKYATIICNVFPSVNRKWLLTGEGSILIAPSENASSILSTSSDILFAPLVGHYAYAGYLSNYGDSEYLDHLPTVPLSTDIYPHGNYVAFDVSGDSMDDGTSSAILENDVVICQQYPRDFYRDSLLPINKYYFVVATQTQGILIKRITSHDLDAHTIALSHQHQTRYIATPYRVDKETQFRAAQVVGRPYSSVLNTKLRRLLDSYQSKLDALPSPAMSCTQLREVLERSQLYANNTISEYLERFTSRLISDRREGYAENVSRSITDLLCTLGGDTVFDVISPTSISNLERYYHRRGISDTTINLRVSNVKAFINSAIRDQIVTYSLHPFSFYRMPQKHVREIDITIEQLRALRAYKTQTLAERVSLDFFFLSFFCAGINLVDLLSISFPSSVGEPLTFVRTKSARSKQGEKRISISLQPEAYEIVKRYRTHDGSLRLPFVGKYHYVRSYITKTLHSIGITLGFEKPLMFYSARKTFCQIGFELGIPLYVLEYSIGHTIKDAHSRPIYDYIRIMRSTADSAIRKIIDAAIQ